MRYWKLVEDSDRIDFEIIDAESKHSIFLARKDYFQGPARLWTLDHIYKQYIFSL